MKKLMLLSMLLLGRVGYAQLATVTVPANPVVRVPSTFMGLGHETSPAGGWGMDKIMGTDATGVNYVYRQLLANLTQYSGPIQIRLGGGTTQDVTTIMPYEPYKELNLANGAQFVFDINQKTATLAQAQAQLLNYSANMPAGSVLAYEIGNEPDLGDWGASDGSGFPAYTASLSKWVTGLQAVAPPSTKFIFASCAVYSCLPNWNQKGLMSQYRPALYAWNSHYYSTYNPNPTADYFLQDYVFTQPFAMAQDVAAAHHLGMKYTVNEFQSNSCAAIIHDDPAKAAHTVCSVPEVYLTDGSDPRWASMQFQGALWGLKSLFDLASVGVDTVYIFGNLNACGTTLCWNPINMFDMLTVAGSPTTYTLRQVWSLYYGALAFQRATANQATLRVGSVAAGTSSRVSAYDTVDSYGSERMTLVNIDETTAGNVNVTPLSTHTSAVVCYLSAASYSASTGITLCGQTFDGSTDGTIQGSIVHTTVTPVAGVYSIPLTATQAAIVTFF